MWTVSVYQELLKEKRKQSKITITPQAATKQPRVVEEGVIDEEKEHDVEPLEEEVSDDE